MQGAGDARALQGLLRTVFLPRRHQPGHVGFGQRDFIAAELGERDVLDDVVSEGGLFGGGGHMFFPMSSPDLRVLRKRTAIYFSSCPAIACLRFADCKLACDAGHPRLGADKSKTWMAGTSPAMTA